MIEFFGCQMRIVQKFFDSHILEIKKNMLKVRCEMFFKFMVIDP